MPYGQAPFVQNGQQHQQQQFGTPVQQSLLLQPAPVIQISQAPPAPTTNPFNQAPSRPNSLAVPVVSVGSNPFRHGGADEADGGAVNPSTSNTAAPSLGISFPRSELSVISMTEPGPVQESSVASSFDPGFLAGTFTCNGFDMSHPFSKTFLHQKLGHHLLRSSVKLLQTAFWLKTIGQQKLDFSQTFEQKGIHFMALF